MPPVTSPLTAPYLVITVLIRALCHRRRYEASPGVIADPVAGSKVTHVTSESSEASGAVTDSNDWRVTVRLSQAGHAKQALDALSEHQVEAEVHSRLGGKVVMGSGGGSELFLYTHSHDAAEAAQQSVRELLASHDLTAELSVDRWHPVAEEWEPAGVPLPADEAAIHAERAQVDAEETSESLAWGHALYEVRVQLASHHESVALAEQLRSQGYPVARRWRFLVVGANNADQAAEFEAAIRELAPAGAQISSGEVGATPFTAFELAANSGL
jgi:hypothetical protein